MFGYEDPSTLTIYEVHSRIVAFNDQLRHFWVHSSGWAPAVASELLAAARLDWQVELSRSLAVFIEDPPTGQEQARLILGWTNLGALVEGTLKLFLCVWAQSYAGSTNARKNRKGLIAPPDGLRLEDLRQFAIAEELLPSWHEWIASIQQRRNAVHAFRQRDLGTLEDFRNDVRQYLQLLRDVNLHLPYPSEYVPPSEVDYAALVRRRG